MGTHRGVQEEFAPTGCFVEKASHFLDDVGKKHSWSTALFKGQKGGKSLAPPVVVRHVCAHPQACEAERITFCNTNVLFCDNYAIDITAKRFG